MKVFTRRLMILGIMGAFLIIFTTGCARKTFRERLFIMGTVFDITLYEGKKENMEALKKQLENYDKLFDANKAYDGINNVYKLNNYFKNDSSLKGIEVEEPLLDIIDLGKAFEEETKGSFNIAIGAVSELWKNSIKNKVLPNDEDLETLRDSTDIENIFVSGDKVKLLNNCQIDLGGIAKGYAVLKAKEYLESNNIRKYVINAGSSTIIMGKYIDGKNFLLSLRNPLKPTEYLETKLTLERISISNSGDYEEGQFFDLENVRYHHIINPVTLRPEHYFRSVVVVGENPLLTEVLSTTLFNMNQEEGLDFIKDLSVEVLWFDITGAIHKSDKFSDYEAKK